MAASTNSTALIYLLLVVAFMTLVLVSHEPSHIHSRSHRRSLPGKRLKVRVVHHDKKHHDPIAFDPVVADFERKKEDRAWEKQYFEEQHKKWAEQGASHEDNWHHGALHGSEPLKVVLLSIRLSCRLLWASLKWHAPSFSITQIIFISGLFLRPGLIVVRRWQIMKADPVEVDPDYEDPEEYLNDEDQFNITNRLTLLFPLLDVNPRDDFVSLLELQEWHLLQGRKAMQHRSDREMETHDKNHDGLVSFEEYLPHLTEEERGQNNTEFGEAGWYKEQFEVCDRDNDGLLNVTEFNDFLHPDDSNNPRVLQWCRMEQLRTHDTNKDAKISWEEFHNGMFEHLRDEQDTDHLHPTELIEANKKVQSKLKFAVLDTNKDGYLTEVELAPVMEKLRPGELYYAKQQSDYLLHEADENRDGRLTLDEMLNHPYIFYSTAYDEDEFDYSQHDEFR